MNRLNLKRFSFGNPKKINPDGRYIKKEQITSQQVIDMYSIYKEYYQNTQFSIFEHDFAKKHGAIVIFHPETHEIIGFSTVDIQHFEYQHKKYTVLFSGDTVIQKEFWGAKVLHRTMLKLVIKLRIRYMCDEFYWLLISKGYKTYLLLANNYYVYYPHVDGKYQELVPIVEKYCKEFFTEYFDEQTGLLNFGTDYQPLKTDVAPITEEMRLINPNIAFFEEKNPTWQLGTELPCIGRIAWSDLIRYPFRFINKVLHAQRFESLKKVRSLSEE